jgi:hypothetical protein
VFNARRLLRYLMHDVLGLSLGEVQEFPFTARFFKEHGLYTPLVKLYHGRIREYARGSFPDLLDDVEFPRKGARWPPFPWTGNVVRVIKQVIEGEEWPDGFWEIRGKYGRAKLVFNYMRANRGIDLMQVTEVEAMMLGMEQPWRLLHDGLHE